MTDDPRQFRHRPGAVLGGAALVLATAAAVLVGPVSTLSLSAAAVGVVGVTGALVRGDRRIAVIGAFGLLGAVVAAGWAGGSPGRLLPATAAALLSWEFANSSFERRRELRGGSVGWSEVVHVGAAAGVGIVSTAIAYVGSRGIDLGVSMIGVVLLFLAAVTLGLSLRE